MSGEKYTSVEMLAALYATLWGLFMANPMIDSFPRNPKLYAAMLELIPYESVWGLIAATGGGLALYFAVTGRRQKSAAISGLIFCAFSMLFLISDLTSPAFILFGLIAVFNFIHWRTLKWKSAKAGNG